LASTIIIDYNSQREACLIPVYHRAVLIYNPVAGKLLEDGGRVTARVMRALAAAGHKVAAKPTPGAGRAASLARDAVAGGADLVLAFGGDGTINEVAEGLIGSQVPLGLIPGGTANVLACELKVGTKPEAAARHLADWQPRRIATGRVQCAGTEPRHFLAMAGIGLDAHIVYNMSADVKKKWGKLAYWAGGFGQLARTLEEFDVVVDGHRHRASFALLTKVRNYGGDLQIARNVSILDDQFEVVLFEGRNSFKYLKYFTGVAVNQLQAMKGVTILRGRKACFRADHCERVYVQIDGEYAGVLPAQVELTPCALTLLMP
jgi:diacylglycerol kinase (ATP)